MQTMFILVVCGRIILRCLIVKTIIFDKCLFMGERSRVVVYLFQKTVANDSGTCVAKSNCKTLMPEIDKKRSVIITVFYLNGSL